MNKICMRIICLLSLVCFATTGIPTAQAAYPEKPINIVVPYPAGTTADIGARLLASALQKHFKEPLVVVNRAGGSGVVGTMSVLKAPADGYTLLLGRFSTNGSMPALNKNLKYKHSDFSYLGMINHNPFVFVVNKKSPYKSMKELGKAIKDNPGSLTCGTAGPLTIQDVAAYAFLQALGLGRDAARVIPFKTDVETKPAVMGQHVDFAIMSLATIMDQLGENGTVRALAVNTVEPLKDMPDIPVLRATGFASLEQLSGWAALCGPAGLPAEVVKQWEKALAGLQSDPAYMEAERKAGFFSMLRSPEESRNFVDSQVQIYTKLGTEMNLFIK